ncbi:MAG TPA: hypothetical protein VFL86_19960 [Burkholderiaceae bacterium]|nr:hypothetical protein [Burkholderiaceae bacterium]
MSLQYGVAAQPASGSAKAGAWRESLRAGGSGSAPNVHQPESGAANNESVYEDKQKDGSRGSSTKKYQAGSSSRTSEPEESLVRDRWGDLRRKSEVGHVDRWGNNWTHSDIERDGMVHIWTRDGASAMAYRDNMTFYKRRGGLPSDERVTQAMYDADQERITALIDAGDSALNAAVAEDGRRWFWRVTEDEYEARMAKLRGSAGDAGGEG